MTEYRLYCLDKAGRFTKVHEIDASSDRQALAIANDMKLAVACEL